MAKRGGPFHQWQARESLGYFDIRGSIRLSIPSLLVATLRTQEQFQADQPGYTVTWSRDSLTAEPLELLKGCTSVLQAMDRQYQLDRALRR